MSVKRIEKAELIPVERINTPPVDCDATKLIPIKLLKANGTKHRTVETQPITRGERYATVAEYFKAGNPNATTYRLGKPWIKRKSFSASRRIKIHKENGGCCQVCGSTLQLEVEHWRGLQNGGGNERSNLKSLCHTCHSQKTGMDKSLRRQRDKLLQRQR